MRVEKVHISGFRNFNDEEIYLQEKTLIIGANDVGKTNFIYALRLLFDKTISEHDLELTDGDFNAYSGTDTVIITAYLCDIEEECLISVFGGSLNEGKTIIRYVCQKGGSYKFYIGYSEETLEEKQTRIYIRRINMQCVDTNRNLFSFLNRERNKMLLLAKEQLSSEDMESDKNKITDIQNELNTINREISTLHYVASSLEQVNGELSKLSIHNEDQRICFVAGESKADKLLNNLVLSYSTGDTSLSIGGDGRNNQIFLATWISKQHMQDNIDHVTFYAIEEPEAHLHPHQQRRLSSYILNEFDKQVLITTHSPQIASGFDPASIVRLYVENKYSIAACSGCSEYLKTVFDEFGYRLNTLSAEIFFSDGVFLVEGVSEVILFTALAREIGLDLDKYNVSIISVEGIGFLPYVAVCNALCIPWTIRTDNDIFTKSNDANKMYFAGLNRVVRIIEKIGCFTELIDYWEKNKSNNEWNGDESIPENAIILNKAIRDMVNPAGFYLSNIDLENDLANSPIGEELMEHYDKHDIDSLVKAMQQKKAENMFNFVVQNHTSLIKLKDSPMTDPLVMLINRVNERTHPRDE